MTLLEALALLLVPYVVFALLGMRRVTTRDQAVAADLARERAAPASPYPRLRGESLPPGNVTGGRGEGQSFVPPRNPRSAVMSTFAGTPVLIMGAITIRRHATLTGEFFAVDHGGRCAGAATTFEGALIIALRRRDDGEGSPPLAPDVASFPAARMH